MLNSVISVEAMRACEEFHFASGYTTGVELMQIAGSGCVREFVKFFSLFKHCQRVVIYIGKGNNGGDGIVMASELAALLPVPVILAVTSQEEELSETSRHFFKQLNDHVIVAEAKAITLQSNDIVIDALLGTGCRGMMKEPYKSLINNINNSHVPVFAVDIPSGLGTDCCIKAAFTAVIGYFKDVLFTPDGIENCGRLRQIKLPLPLNAGEFANAPQATAAEWFCNTQVTIKRSVHKYSRGHVLICGGSKEFIQAPFLTARSTLRSGAGMVHLAVPFAAVPGSGTLAVIPMECANINGSLCAESWKNLEKLLTKIDVIAVGPGMGRSPAAGEFIAELLTIDKPLVLDADAIYLASQHIDLLRKRSMPTVLTPHRGEAGFLAQACALELPGQPLSAAKMLAQATAAVILLKGARTVTAAPSGKAFINTSGTPALATAGSGDCLTGVLASEIALLAASQVDLTSETILTAAARSAFLHGLAGELSEQEFSSIGVIADDLPDFIARSRAQIEKNGDIF